MSLCGRFAGGSGVFQDGSKSRECSKLPPPVCSAALFHALVVMALAAPYAVLGLSNYGQSEEVWALRIVTDSPT